MVKKKNSTVAASSVSGGAAAKASPNPLKRGAPDAPPPAPALPAPSSSTVGSNPGDWPASTTTRRDEKKARSLGLIPSDEGNVILPAVEEAEASPVKRPSDGFADEDDIFDLDEGFIEPPSKKAKSCAILPNPAASEASAPAAVPAAQISTVSSLSKGKDIPSTAAAATPSSGKPDLRAVISSLETFASQYTSLEADKARVGGMTPGIPKACQTGCGRAAGHVEVLVVGTGDAGKGAAAEGAGQMKSTRTAKPPTERNQEAAGKACIAVPWK
nr:uncharacterized protein LOC127315455 [Lolium perenne]